METIKVNMSPNPLDVQTIHASQNDGEARQWEFELHNNGELIDTSEITEQLFFKSYKGGTEQILPENTSTPTTSPFNGDIKYPQGLLTDQEFTYRQSPAEEDGLAKITDVKGNTLVWNQLVENGNFADTSVWQNYGSTFTVSGNTATVKTTNASNQFGIFQTITFKANHKYFISFEAKKHGTITLKRNRLSSGQEQIQEGLYRTIETASADSTLSSPIRILFGEPVSDIANDYFMVKNYMIIDLTQMGLDITDPSEFTSLFSKPYYDYCQGAMLSFGGRNMKFNQLVKNGNFADTSNWSSSSNVVITASNNILQVTNAIGRDGDYYSAQNVTMKIGHKYYFHAEAKKTDVSTAQTLAIVFFGEASNTFAVDVLKENANWNSKSTIFTCVSNTYNFIRLKTQVANATNEFRNVMLIDLTEMFGAGGEPSVEGFKELLHNDYYEYTTGKYMNIGQPMSLKTTGKNLLNPANITALDGITKTENGWSGTAGKWLQSTEVGTNWEGIRFLPNVQYYVEATALSVGATWIRLRITHSDGSIVNSNQINGGNSGKMSVLSTANKTVVSVSVYYGSYGGTISELTDFAIMISDSVADFEPYTSSTLSLPISTYFPNGMKSAGNVYDELTESKAITKIGEIDLGTLSWGYASSVQRFYALNFANVKTNAENVLANINCALYENSIWSQVQGDTTKNKVVSVANKNILIRDTTYTDPTAFKTAMSGVYLYYELANPTETSFATASLVTENAEIPLSAENDVLVGKCTEELSAQSGFIDAKIKLTDGDGTCYSNKIQLHVERKPS